MLSLEETESILNSIIDHTDVHKVVSSLFMVIDRSLDIRGLIGNNHFRPYIKLISQANQDKSIKGDKALIESVVQKIHEIGS